MGVPKSARRFSYCLPGLSSPVKSTFLRFGNDISKERPTFKRTGFILNAGNDYRVRLLNISIGGRVLNLPQGSFFNGCMLDVGTATSRLGPGAYIAVLYTLQRYFHHYNLMRLRDVPRSESDLCYRLQSGFRNYPGMVFHIEGADLEIGPENLFRFATNRFCLALFGTGKKSTVLGAYQQQNVRFIYELGKRNYCLIRRIAHRIKLLEFPNQTHTYICVYILYIYIYNLCSHGLWATSIKTYK